MPYRFGGKTVLLALIVIILTILTLFIFAGCGHVKDEAQHERFEDLSSDRETITIADQFGIAYAPLEIMKEKKFLESALSEAGLNDIIIEWKKFGNTTAIREAMLSDDLDVGFVGIPPFLLGLDNGMNWKIIAGLSESKVALVTKDDSIKTLKDITYAHRIILPQPGSIQHILLQMASKEELGNANAFDNQLIALSHPDGVIGFTAGDEKQLHFTTPPYLQEDLKISGATQVVDGITCFGGEFTFIVGICQDQFYSDQAVYEAFLKAIEKSINYIKDNRSDAIEILKNVYEYSESELEMLLSEEQMTFTTEVKGIDHFMDFMFETGTLRQKYDKDAIFWNN